MIRSGMIITALLGFMMLSSVMMPLSVTAETGKASSASVQNDDTGKTASGSSDYAYILGPGDILGIEVWKDESLTRAVVILPDGKISYPLVGELTAAGKTISQFKNELAQKLSRFVNAPTINIEVKQPSSMYVYVLGKVNSPGRFLMTSSINVLQGLATAGGLNPFAKKNDIRVYRQENGRTSIFEFEYDDVTEGKNMGQNIQLRRGDVIIVP